MNDELHQLYAADVWEHRQGYPMGSPEYAAMRERDRHGRLADELIAIQALQDAEDYHAARLFQHGETPMMPGKPTRSRSAPPSLGIVLPAGWRRQPTIVGACTRG
jgi:hypothetical protein